MKGRFALPIAWAALGAFIVTVGAITPLLLWIHAGDYISQDTYFVIAHWHYDVSLIAACVIFATIYALCRPSAGLRRRMAWAHYAVWVLGCLLIFGPGWVLPVVGMPRRYEDVPIVFARLNWIYSAGYVLTLVGLLIFLSILVDASVRALASKLSPRVG